MSAHKRALLTPDSAALRRLDELAAQLRATSRPDPAAQRAARQEALAQVAQAVTHSEQRQSQVTTRLDETLSGMDSRMRELEQATGQALLAQAAEFQAELAQSGGLLAAHSDALLQAQAEQYAALLEEVQAARQAQMQAEQDQAGLQQDLHQAQQQYANMQEELRGQLSWRQSAGRASAAALRQAWALLEALQQTYPQQAQGWGGMQALLEQAQANLAEGFGEAALATAQQVSFQLGEIRIGLEQDLAERSLLQAAALEQARQVQALLEANRVVNAIDLEGRSLDFPLEVNFWTGGGWEAQHQALQEALAYLAQPPEALAQSDLRGLMRDYLANIRRSVPELVAAARRNVLASQLRYNLAEAVLAALGEQGFALEQANYMEGDMRQAYQLALHNLEGSQLVVTLAPQAGTAHSGAEHQLDLHSLDYTRRTPHELRQRARELARSLRRYGLQVGSPVGGPVSEPYVPAYPLPTSLSPAVQQVSERKAAYLTGTEHVVTRSIKH